MSFMCLEASLAFQPGYRCRTRSETAVRCAASPFGDAKNTASTSSPSPFGSAAASPFGSGAKTVAADPFASGAHESLTLHRVYTIRSEFQLTDVLPQSMEAAGVNPKKKQSDISSEQATKKSATTEYRAWEDVDIFEVPPELRRPDKDGEQDDVLLNAPVMCPPMVSNQSCHPSLPSQL